MVDVVSAVRSARSRYGISPRQELAAVVKAPAGDVELLQQQVPFISSLAKTSSLTVAADAAKPAESSTAVASGLEIYTCLSGLVDFDAERARIKKELDKVSADAAKFEKKLSNPGFLAKAAEEIIQKDRADRKSTRLNSSHWS